MDAVGGFGRVAALLAGMAEDGASDIFLAVDRPPARRRSGALETLDLPPLAAADLEDFVVGAMGEATWSRFRAQRDLDLGWSDPEGRRYRVNLGMERGRPTLVARLVPAFSLSFEALGLPEGVRRLAEAPRGLVLVTGATGSGKSTTLAAMVDHLNRTRACHVLTIEDPIEFVHHDRLARITQREVGTDTASFREALRHAVRQSPDVLMVGELRDLDSLQAALSAALTGHLVLASLHTVDASQTLQRILSLYPEHQRGQAALELSLSLAGVVCQRLVPREEGPGRVVAVELLTATPAVRRLVREQRVEEIEDLMRASRTGHHQTFNRALVELHRAGTISFEAGRAYATNPEAFVLAARGMATGVEAFRGEEPELADRGLDMKALLRVAVRRGASDLHLTVGRRPILRIDGRLRPLRLDPLTAADMRTLLYSVMSVRQRTIYELEKEVDFALALEDGRRFRVNAYLQRGHMAAALRAIPARVPDAAALRLPETVLAMGEASHGLLLVVGPTGSGKTTTLACLVDRINRTRPCRILTVEDPIEYLHPSRVATVDQREVGADTRSFAAALKYVLRQDPDVVMIGEMRDLETVSAALTAAETGHLVLATLHANDAPQTIARVVDVFPPHQQAQARSQLAACLLGVVSQRLLLHRDGRGRVPAFEILVATPAVRAQIREDRMHQAVTTMETARGEGMVTMDHALRELLRQGEIAWEEAARYARNPRSLGPPPGG